MLRRQTAIRFSLADWAERQWVPSRRFHCTYGNVCAVCCVCMLRANFYCYFHAARAFTFALSLCELRECSFLIYGRPFEAMTQNLTIIFWIWKAQFRHQQCTQSTHSHTRSRNTISLAKTEKNKLDTGSAAHSKFKSSWIFIIKNEFLFLSIFYFSRRSQWRW